jgi:hypothetical protein
LRAKSQGATTLLGPQIPLTDDTLKQSDMLFPMNNFYGDSIWIVNLGDVVWTEGFWNYLCLAKPAVKFVKSLKSETAEFGGYRLWLRAMVT